VTATKTGARPAVFFDRDGVLIEDREYVFRPEDLHWIPGAVDAIRFLNQNNFLVFVVSNQSGVARGYYGEPEVEKFFAHMQRELSAQDARIDDYRYCPDHPDGTIERYRKASAWRKPEPGMILDLLDHWDVDRAGSFLIGDKPSDIDAAHAAGLEGYLFEGGDLSAFLRATLAGREAVR
jgi:D-glycero-D-manno-heptose 1,7-bisphosphate phosphatase